MYPHVNAKETVDLEESAVSYVVENEKKATWKDYICLNISLRVIIALLLTTVVAPVLIYRYLFFTTLELPPSDGLSFGSCLVPRHIRLPCGYGDVLEEDCHSDCCYDQHNNTCFHRFPSRFSYLLNEPWTESVLLTPRITREPFVSQNSFTNIRLSVDEISATHLSLTFYKSDELITGRRLEDKKYEYDIGGKAGTLEELQVIINGLQGAIFNTARGPFIASDDIWEIAFKITDEVMYGLGEIPIRENTTKVIYSHKGGLSSVPLIYARSNGAYHGLLIDTTAPTEVDIRSENQLVIRSITKFGLKFHLFVGPDPVDIMKDVTELIATDKKLEYWMLGAHVCSELPSDDPVTGLRNFINDANTARLPFDSHCGIAPVVFNTDCNNQQVTLVNNGVATLRNARKKFVPHVSPYIRYTIPPEEPEEEDKEEGESEENELIKRETTINDQCFDGEEYEQYIIRNSKSDAMYFGTIDGLHVIYPIYDMVNENFMHQLWLYSDFDAVILENNWPLDESENEVNDLNLFLPYFNENFEKAFSHTPLWNATRPERYLDTHNQYGIQFAKAFQKINPVTAMSTSQWMNGNVGVNRQNIETSWSSLHRELIEASLGGISGHWYWSSPICGDTTNFDNENQIRLCAKWYMAATYFPMIKIHSKEVQRNPLAFVGTDRAHMITALTKRMKIMPYIYTVLQEGPLLRPMFYQYPAIEELANVTTQFSVGNDLLIVPNLQPSQSHVHFWMPPGQWYEFWGGLKIEGETGDATTMTTTEADFLTLMRGGSIIMIHEEIRLTTEETRRFGPFDVIIALHCETKYVDDVEVDEEVSEPITEEIKKKFAANDETITQLTTTTTEPTTTEIPTITVCSARGKVFVTPSMTLIFEADAETLTITAEGDDFESLCDNSANLMGRDIWYITIFGLHVDDNNEDNLRRVITHIDLCDLRTEDKITHGLLDW